MSNALPHVHTDTCRNCGQDIIRVDTGELGGKKWTHVGPPRYWWCKNDSGATAGPSVPDVITGQVPVSGNQE